MKFTMASSHRPNAAFSQVMMENIGWCVLGGERVAEEVRCYKPPTHSTLTRL